MEGKGGLEEFELGWVFVGGLGEDEVGVKEKDVHLPTLQVPENSIADQKARLGGEMRAKVFNLGNHMVTHCPSCLVVHFRYSGFEERDGGGDGGVVGMNWGSVFEDALEKKGVLDKSASRAVK